MFEREAAAAGIAPILCSGCGGGDGDTHTFQFSSGGRCRIGGRPIVYISGWGAARGRQFRIDMATSSSLPDGRSLFPLARLCGRRRTSSDLRVPAARLSSQLRLGRVRRLAVSAFAID